jgi:putative phosphoribosyl transferase
MGTALFSDRRDAGRRLAARAERWRHEAPVVLAVSRGGVPVALEIARALAAPLDVLAVHKVGPPGNRVGAVAEGGQAVIDHDRARALGLSGDDLSELRRHAREAADADAASFRDGAPPRNVVGRTVVLVADGALTGASVTAAARTARHRGAARVVLALPAAEDAALTRVGEAVDEVVCAQLAPPTAAYADSAPITDAAIASALEAAGPIRERDLHVPEAARGVVVLATGSALVRETLDAMGFATLQVTGRSVDDIAAAAARLRTAPATERLRLGLFGFGGTAETASAAAPSCGAAAVVAAGGRPDQEATSTGVPTLVIVGGEDRARLRIVRAAGDEPGSGARQVAVVAGATRAFAEPGALDQVAHLAGGWFARHLPAEVT